jgi:hypothetical protein
MDPRKVIIIGGALVATIVATNHFVQLSTKYSCWFDGTGPGTCEAPAPAAARNVQHNAPLPN